MHEAALDEAKTVPVGWIRNCEFPHCNIGLSTMTLFLSSCNPSPKNLCSLWLRWTIQLIFEHIERTNNCSAEFLRKRVWRRRRGEWMTKLGLSDVFVQSWDKLFCPPPPKRPLCNFSFRSLTSSAAFQGFSDTWLLFHTLTKSWNINVHLIFATTWYFGLHM